MRATALLVLLGAAAGCGPGGDEPGKRPAPAARPSWPGEPKLRSAPVPSDKRLHLAETLVQQERLAEAAAEYRRLLDHDGKDVAALAGLGRVSGLMGDAASSLAFAARAAELRPGDAAIQNQLGVALVMGGRRHEAAQTFEKAIGLQPQDPLARINAALNWADLGEWTRAEESAKKAAELLPKDPTPWIILGRLYVRQGRHAEAVPFYREAVRRGPGHGLANYHLAKVLVASGRRAEAPEPARAVLQGAPPPEIRAEMEALLRSP